jgi:hypothetical protein
LREGFVFADEAGAHEEDVARVEHGTLGAGDVLENGDGDVMRGEGRYGEGVLLGVGDVVEEDAAADYAAVLGDDWACERRFLQS